MTDIYSVNLNATQAGIITNSVDNSGHLLTILLIFTVAIFISFMLSDQKRFDYIADVIVAVVRSCKYAIVGTITLLTGYAIYLLCNAIADSTKGIDPMWYVYAIGGYITLTVAGYIVVRIANLIAEMYARHVESKVSKVNVL